MSSLIIYKEQPDQPLNLIFKYYNQRGFDDKYIDSQPLFLRLKIHNKVDRLQSFGCPASVMKCFFSFSWSESSGRWNAPKMHIPDGSPRSSCKYRGVNSRVRWPILSPSLAGVSFAPLSDRLQRRFGSFAKGGRFANEGDHFNNTAGRKRVRKQWRMAEWCELSPKLKLSAPPPFSKRDGLSPPQEVVDALEFGSAVPSALQKRAIGSPRNTALVCWLRSEQGEVINQVIRRTLL